MTSDFEFYSEIENYDIDILINEIETPNYLSSDVKPFERPLEEEINRIYSEYQLPDDDIKREDSSNCFENHFQDKKIHSIKSMVGDDEVVTTNSLLYAVAVIVIGPLLSKVKISWQDVQFSRHLFNYAEGWILLPPSIDSSFEAVNRYSRGNGIPFVLDNLKFKNLSPVRKQSDMNVDLSSKFRNLSEAAAWTDPDWFTYDMHQFALILGVETFDFVGSKQFPFLFKWEGGCGGAPPWNNLLTSAGAVFRYKRGRARRGILGIMEDTHLLITGNRKPKDCWFARNLNLAMNNDERWARVTSELEWRSSEAHKAGLEPVTLEREVADQQLPVELINLSATIVPDDTLTGIGISYLREKGYILTETDLISAHNSHLRTMSIWGDIPMREIEDQINLRKETYREAYLERLDIMTRQDHHMPKVYEKLFSIGSSFENSALEVMANYYRMRVEQNSIFTSFMYDDRIRIFKASDINDYYQKDMKSIRNQFAIDCESNYRPDQARTFQLPDERRKMDKIEHWLNSKPLEDLFKGRLPPGIGPDDARIARDIASSLADDVVNYDGLIYLIISDDRKMIQSIQSLVDSDLWDKSPVEARIVGLGVNDLIRWYLTPRQSHRRQNLQYDWVQAFIPNPYDHNNYAMMDGVLLDAMVKEAKYFYGKTNKRIRVFYDYPNINRKLKRFYPDPELMGVQELTGGFLRRSTAQVVTNLASKSLDRISSFKDFSYMEKGRRGPFKKRDTLKLYSAKRGFEIQSPWR